MEKCFFIWADNFLKKFHLVVLIFALIFTAGCSSDQKGPLLAQEPLPYTENALEPYISGETMNLHYNKHYAGYVSKTNALLESNTVKGKTLEQVIRSAYANKKQTAVFTNAAQAWNHSFFWKCLKPNGRTLPQGKLKKMIDHSFGSYAALKKMLVKSADTIVGNGWIWIIQDGSNLKVITTSNADTPIAHGKKPLFTIDVWEHAYYLDYHNKRSKYVTAILDNIIDWEFVASQLN
jgi:Fe-Mn family superoxide dismutase